MRLFTGLRLLLTNPTLFKARLKNLLHAREVSLRLKSLASLNPERPVWLEYDGVQFPYFDDADGQEVSYHMHFSEWLASNTSLFMPYIKPGDIIVDVGANLGFTTLIFSKLTGEHGEVNSFEPGGRMYSKLSAMVARNQLNNVRLHNMGCGEKQDVLTLTIPESSGNSSLRPTEDVKGQTVRTENVNIHRLDDILIGKNAIALIKIDTEGFEIEVLRGAEVIIQRCRPVIYIELCAEYRESSMASIRWLKEHGYHFPVEPDLDAAHNGSNFFALPGS
jgi:FkbM family methyltransferase